MSACALGLILLEHDTETALYQEASLASWRIRGHVEENQDALANSQH